jgi:large subunit ribosomal protein L15
MKAPFRIRPVAKGGVFRCNEDPKRLDDAYVRMLGPNGASVLSDEVKWLAVTHKSFDHGRRGFNDRLAFFGRRIIELQTAQALLNSPQAQNWPKNHLGEFISDKYGRKPFQHPALNGLQGLTDEATHMVLNKARLLPIAERYGLDKVTRWVPIRADNLQASGIDSVLQTSLYAIVGAIALERGGDAANKVVQDAILEPLGFTFASEA